jgi:hypothetical protein
MRASCARLPERGRIMYGVIDFSVIDTDPGAASAFAPPAEFLGDYVHFLRERQRNDPGVRQHVAVVGRMLLELFDQVAGLALAQCSRFALLRLIASPSSNLATDTGPSLR